MKMKYSVVLCVIATAFFICTGAFADTLDGFKGEKGVLKNHRLEVGGSLVKCTY